MKPKRALISLILILGLTTGAAVAAGFPNPLQLFGLGKVEPTPPAQVSPRAPLPAAPAGPPLSFAEIARMVRPAVVNVSTTQTIHTQGSQGFGQGAEPFGENDPFSQFFRHFSPQMPRNFTQRALGSGVIIDPDGSIVTNAHVVKNAQKVVVKLEDKRELDAKVVGIDEKTDVALLKIESPGTLTVAALGNSDDLQVGDWVVAIGNPFGLSETVTAGIVSAKGRVIGEGPYDDFIQTDASINPGNSGGPLLDVQGQVIGINAAIFSQSGGNIGIGFAIPINLVKHVVEQLKTHGKVVRGWVGVAIQDVTPDLAHSFELKKAEGALVADVTPDSPALHAGLERGDIITDYDGTHIEAAHQLPTLVAETPVGKTVSVGVLRNGHPKTLSLTIAEMPAGEAAAAAPQSEESWGLTVSNITPDMAQQFNLEQHSGVVVTDLADGSPASDAGIQPGDVIAQANRQPVHDVAEYRKALASGENPHQLLLLVTRQGQSFFVALNRGE
ncbi:MAG: DegQ family serine endoprotease [Candidatus Binatia bacterium]